MANGGTERDCGTGGKIENNLESSKSGHYNETQVRREFVDPFFKALGLDIDKKQGLLRS